jgi:uncharacterized protein (DUF1501 family)
VHLSELLPRTARQMHRLALIRSVNTHEDDHAKGHYLMVTGRRQTAQEHPELGAVVARALDEPGRSNGKPPQFSERPQSLAENAVLCANDIRRRINDRFALRRRTAETEAYTQCFEQAQELMKRREVFDVAREPASEVERYGSHDFGRHCLLARRLIEQGVTFVQVTHSNYDTHNENFNFHFEQVGEFDGPFAALIDDLAQRGLLAHTLVVVLSEFGRTPHINHLYGRDHWSKAWSICLGGAGLQAGAVIGKTNDHGTEVTERQVDTGHLFHTYLSALGLKSTGNFTIAGQKVPMADPAFGPIDELLA